MPSGGTVQTVFAKQSELLKQVASLHFPEGFDADISYGNGQFWKESGLPIPTIRLDLDPAIAIGGSIIGDSTALPLADNSLDSVVFDPPFLTYIRKGRGGNGSMAMAKRFGGYWRYDELEFHYRSTFNEVSRVLKPKGKLLLKCQDIVHNHKLHPTGANCIWWAAGSKLRLLDQFILAAAHRMPSPNRKGTQKHARIHHCWFQVYEKVRNLQSVAGSGTLL